MKPKPIYKQMGRGLYLGPVDTSNKSHGVGQMLLKDGSLYQGEWKHGQRHGEGKMLHKSGDFYIGNYKNNRRHGFGEYYYAVSKEKYVGMWERGRKHGSGEYFYHKGDHFMGHFEKDCKHGHGQKRSNENILFGKWLKNVKQGTFILFNIKTCKSFEIKYKDNLKMAIRKLKRNSTSLSEINSMGIRFTDPKTHKIDQPFVKLFGDFDFDENAFSNERLKGFRSERKVKVTGRKDSSDSQTVQLKDRIGSERNTKKENMFSKLSIDQKISQFNKSLGPSKTQIGKIQIVNKIVFKNPKSEKIKI